MGFQSLSQFNPIFPAHRRCFTERIQELKRFKFSQLSQSEDLRIFPESMRSARYKNIVQDSLTMLVAFLMK